MTNVLIVEDNVISARMLEVNLKRAGYTTIVAKTGREALQKLESAAGAQLIITDIMMADMDGFRLLQSLKASERWKGIPVIMCSSLGGVENVRRAVTLGCRHYLVKPIQPAVLLKKVSDALAEDKPALLDKSEVLTQFGLDDEAYGEAATTFRGLVKEQLELLARLKKNPKAPLRPALRTLLEGGSILGAERLSHCVSDLLVVTEGSISLGGWQPGYRLLLAELETVQKALAPASPKG